MDKTAIEKIIEVSEPHIVEENGFKYSDKMLAVIEKPQVNCINLKTLSSLVDLIRIETETYTKPVLVKVTTPTEVNVYSGIEPSDRTREMPYSASAETVQFNFGHWYSYENMMIALKSKFVETSELNEVVKLLGTITEENNMQIADDGFTQTMVVKKGVVLKENKAVNPRVKLTPFCTFNEVEQPEREFLLRFNGCGEAALFEADGGAWKLKAREYIADYLRNALSDVKDVYVIE